MSTREFVIATRNASLVEAAKHARGSGQTTWCESFGETLRAIDPRTDLLVIDAALGGPLARLLVALFVDNRAGRHAILIEVANTDSTMQEDERITVLGPDTTKDQLVSAIADHEIASGYLPVQAGASVPESLHSDDLVLA